MGTYTGNPAAGAASTDPPTITTTDDDTGRAAASVDPTFEQLADLAAAYVHYGVKTNTANVITGNTTFQGRVAFSGEVDYLSPMTLTGTATIGVDQTDWFIVPKGTLPGSAQTVTLRETGPAPSAGARLKVSFLELNVGANVWRFQSGIGSQLLHVDNTGFTPDPYTVVEFYFDGEHWQVGACYGAIVSIP